jgi:hypothetical protein
MIIEVVGKGLNIADGGVEITDRDVEMIGALLVLIALAINITAGLGQLGMGRRWRWVAGGVRNKLPTR